MIKAVFFDVGGVLIRNVGPQASFLAAKILGTSPREVTRILVRFIGRVAEDKMSEATFWRNIGKEFGASPRQIKKLLPIFAKRKVRPKTRVFAIARKLRQCGYTVGILSDVIPSHAKVIRKLGIYHRFSPLLLSYQTGVSKRRMGAYRNAARRARVKYSEMVFLDNHSYLVAKAKKLGIKAFVYKNPTQLVRSLRRFGVEI